jgi:hypothetical protein
MEKPVFPDYEDKIAQVRVLMSKARNMFSSAFTVLDDIRRELGDEQFASWCFHELRISASILNTISGVLSESDSAILRENMSRAKEADRERKKAATAEKQAEVDAVRAERENKRAEKEREVKAKERREKRDQKQAVLVHAMKDDNYRKAMEAAFSDELTELLAEYRQFKKTSNVEAGSYFVRMREEVNMHRAGKDPTGKWWTWNRWCDVNLGHSRQHYLNCIEEYYTSVRGNAHDVGISTHFPVQSGKRVLN